MIRLHHVAFSRSFRVMWALEELGLDYDVVRYRIEDGSLRSPEMLAMNPGGRAPALEIDGLTMSESGAMLVYLAETRPAAGLSPPPGSPERARFFEMIGFSETMASLLENLNLNHVFLRDPSQASPVVIKLLTARLKASLGALETMITEDYAAGPQFTFADCMLGYNLLAAPYYVALDAFPTLISYLARLEERPAFVAARERDGVQTIYSQKFYPVPPMPEASHG
ncbi:MAG: glutathione S-transferase family protein [Pseudomonadota bacterium]